MPREDHKIDPYHTRKGLMENVKELRKIHCPPLAKLSMTDLRAEYMKLMAAERSEPILEVTKHHKKVLSEREEQKMIQQENLKKKKEEKAAKEASKRKIDGMTKEQIISTVLKTNCKMLKDVSLKHKTRAEITSILEKADCPAIKHLLEKA